ncbi:MAG TPA: sialidase family protein, partial [Holophagaceae bacterium]
MSFSLRLPASLVLCAALAAGQKPKPAVPAAKSPVSPVDAARLVALKARSIGPAIMGGRVSDLAVDPASPDTFYVGLATGGVWKTVNAGATFTPIFDKQPVASIGAVAVAPSDPKVVWVGTGEGNDRNSSGWGNGVYRSTDGGATWTHVGLAWSKAIPRIAVDPKDPATAYVAVIGDLWNPGGKRGLFKTTDGGKTWKAVLTAPSGLESHVGCGDVVLDPASPTTVYAALYARQRTPWSFTYGPAASNGQDVGGIYRSLDGGATWHKLAKGLPTLTGRIGLDVSRSNPKIVMAVIQSDEGGTTDIDNVLSKAGGVFRSEDGGDTWTRVNALDPRPFYFSQIRIDPANPQRVYVAGYMLDVSDDGGRTFREDLFKHVHPDCHALAFPKADPPKAEAPKPGESAHSPVTSRLLLGTDGGVYQSYQGGHAWLHLNRIPAGEFYRITLDDSTPYRIAGGLQDNENWVGPSRTASKEGIRNCEWTAIGGGDGFSCVFDPQDHDLIYAESQGGTLHRFNLRTGEFKPLQPVPAEGQPAFRFNWNAPLIGSVHTKGVLYLGGNRVFRLTDRGEHWKLISPDLSTQDPAKIMTTGSGAETYGVVFTLAESPVKAGLLWAGTDDGKLWITEDDGAHWTDLTAHVPAPARGQWISRIDPSSHDAKVAYLAVDAHRA